jgi:hypothetical protein
MMERLWLAHTAEFNNMSYGIDVVFAHRFKGLDEVDFGSGIDYMGSPARQTLEL